MGPLRSILGEMRVPTAANYGIDPVKLITSINHITIYAERCAIDVATRGCAIRPGRDRIER